MDTSLCVEGCSGSSCPTTVPSCVNYNKNLTLLTDRYIKVEPMINWVITNPGPGLKPLCAGEDMACENPAVRRILPACTSSFFCSPGVLHWINPNAIANRAAHTLWSCLQDNGYSFQFYGDRQCRSVAAAPYDVPVEDNAPSFFCRKYAENAWLGFRDNGATFQVCTGGTGNGCAAALAGGGIFGECNTQVELGACIQVPQTTTHWMRIYPETGCSTT